MEVTGDDRPVIIQYDTTTYKERAIVQLGRDEKLIAENSGILNWLIAGYAMWKKEGLEEPEAVRQANEEYKMDMDAVETFVNDCLEIDASLKWRLHTKLLY